MPRPTTRAPTTTVYHYLIVLLVIVSSTIVVIEGAFVPPCSSLSPFNSILWLSETTALAVTPGQRPPPRRNLKKRRSRRDRNRRGRPEVFHWDTSEGEIRPLLKSRSIEAGTDYWIDPADLAREQARETAVKNHKAMEGEIPMEKLRTEVIAPYTQNWIGWLSVLIVVLVTILTKFPELSNPPPIPYPDL